MEPEKYIFAIGSRAQILPPKSVLISGRIGAIATQARFPADHTGFQGHFPDNALLPGFLHIELVLDILRHYFPSVELAAVQSAKFIVPVLPEQLLDVRINIEMDAMVTAQVHVASTVVSVLELRVSGVVCGTDQKS